MRATWEKAQRLKAHDRFDRTCQGNDLSSNLHNSVKSSSMILVFAGPLSSMLYESPSRCPSLMNIGPIPMFLPSPDWGPVRVSFSVLPASLLNIKFISWILIYVVRVYVEGRKQPPRRRPWPLMRPYWHYHWRLAVTESGHSDSTYSTNNI